jgi:hypothetical protein
VGILASVVADPNLKRRCRELVDLSATATPPQKRDRGRKFERLLHDTLEAEELHPRTSYRPQGEEIDGSFQMEQRFFLLEAKWHADALPASAVYQLRDKVDGKLEGTLGVFISASGFSDNAPDTLTRGKKLNVILWDRGDLDELFLTDRTFVYILSTKLRRAADEGLVLVSMRDAEKEEKPQLKARRSPGIKEAIRQMRTGTAESFIEEAGVASEAPDSATLQAAIDDLADVTVNALRRGSTWDDAQALERKITEVGALVVHALRAEDDMKDDLFLVRQLHLGAARSGAIPPPWELWLITLGYYSQELDGDYYREESLSRIGGLLIEAMMAIDAWEWNDSDE